MSELDYEIIDLDLNTLLLGSGSESVDIEDDVAAMDDESDEILRTRALAIMDNNRKDK